MMRTTRLWVITVASLVLLLSGCSGDRSLSIPEEDLPEIEIKRYGQALFGLEPDQLSAGLDSIHEDFSFFLGDGYRDTLQQVQIFRFITDPFNRQLARDCENEFPDLGVIENSIAEGLYRLQAYYPGIAIPQVYTYVSGLLYEQPVQLFDSAVVIALDMYLGRDYEAYPRLGLPHYMTRRMEREYITSDCFREYGYYLAGREPARGSLLDHMIYHGKVMYFLDIVLPSAPDSIKTGYTEDQLTWCRENELRIWTLLIDNELLYSTEAYKINKFIQDGPFTNGLPRSSPAMLGRWVGWQIVNAYMSKNSHVSLDELMQMENPVKILEGSGYRPEK